MICSGVERGGDTNETERMDIYDNFVEFYYRHGDILFY